MAVSRLGKVGMVGVAVALAVVALAAYRLAPGSRPNPLGPAGAAYDRGDYREARAIALEILKRSPDDHAASRVMARASARLGNDETAQTLYARIGEQGMEAEDFFVLGSTLERRGQAAPALAVYERGQKAGPDHAETLHSLARLYARTGQLAQAIDAAGRLAKCLGWEARGSLILGVLDVENSNPEGATSALDAALRVDPRLAGGITSPAEASKLLAGAWLRTDHADRALEVLGPVLTRGDDPEASWLSARASLRLEDAAGATRALALAGDFGKGDPTRQEPAPYVGAGACAGCHPAIFKAQRASRHSRTFSGPADLKAMHLPDGPVADKALPGTSHTLRREGDAVRLTTRSGAKELTALIEYAVGSGDRGLTMVARDEGGVSRVCRVSSYLGGTLWDLTSHAADPQPGDAGGPLGRPLSKGASEKCAACHVTSPRAARDRTAPEAADRGIGCERCHGPGGNHLVAMKLKSADPAIARPSRASAAQINKLCGACHQADDPSTTEADPRFVRFQATTFPTSRCFTEGQGQLSCITCHDPHRDAETKPTAYEARCLACHSTASTQVSKADRSMRWPPCPINPTSGCIGCHMPKVEGAAPHASFTDHQIRIHRSAGADE